MKVTALKRRPDMLSSKKEATYIQDCHQVDIKVQFVCVCVCVMHASVLCPLIVGSYLSRQCVHVDHTLNLVHED